MGIMDDIVALVGAAKKIAARDPDEVIDELGKLFGLDDGKKPKLGVVRATGTDDGPAPDPNVKTDPPAPEGDKPSAPPNNLRTLRPAT